MGGVLTDGCTVLLRFDAGTAAAAAAADGVGGERAGREEVCCVGSGDQPKRARGRGMLAADKTSLSGRDRGEGVGTKL